jgi:hypothetical protein
MKHPSDCISTLTQEREKNQIEMEQKLRITFSATYPKISETQGIP